MARDVMTRDVRSVRPQLPLGELETALLRRGVGGFPVLEAGKLVGVVSRSDVVRELGVSSSVSGQLSDFYRDVMPERETSWSLASEAAEVGVRMAGKTVGDVMATEVLCAQLDQPVRELAELMSEHQIHRLPIVEAGDLVGIVTSMDLVRLLARSDVRVEMDGPTSGE